MPKLLNLLTVWAISAGHPTACYEACAAQANHLASQKGSSLFILCDPSVFYPRPMLLDRRLVKFAWTSCGIMGALLHELIVISGFLNMKCRLGSLIILQLSLCPTEPLISEWIWASQLSFQTLAITSPDKVD